MNTSVRLVGLLLLTLAAGCQLPGLGGGHGHSHEGHGHSHGGHGHGGHGHAHEDHDDTMVFTLHADAYELFVRLDVPVVGERGQHAAHVTRMENNVPVPDGTFAVAYLDADDPARVAASFAVTDVSRRGIFTLEGAPPTEPGRYRLIYRYQGGTGGSDLDEDVVSYDLAEVAEWDAGIVQVGTEAVGPPEQPEGDITFRKETSWSLPFRVRRPRRDAIARPVTVPARVEADPRLTATVTAPAAGRIVWSTEEHVTLAGSAVEKGHVLGRLVPASAYASWNSLELELRQARIELERASSEMERVQGLVRDGLLPDRRLVEVSAKQQAAEAAVVNARRESRARSGRAAPVELQAPLSGVVLELLRPQGLHVEAGEALVRIASAEKLLVSGTLRAAAPGQLAHVQHAVVRPRDAERSVDLLEVGAELLSLPYSVDPHVSGARIAWSVPDDGRLFLGELVELTLGLGTPQEHLTLPLSAIVEVNTRPYVFVQVTGESFERRAVTLGPSDGKRVAILDGVTEEDLVVTVGGFDIYTTSLAGSVESHRH
ncbi:MAG: efflux RND transporter periplasmic adaptor subunit [Acidobacteriota bacterium]